MSETLPLTEMIGLMIGDRALMFINDPAANQRFLEGIDPSYWNYQASVHAEQLDSAEPERRQHAAVALRLVFGQALEALFAMLGAAVQAPRFPLSWLTKYRNEDLRSVVRKIHRGSGLLSCLNGPATWGSVSQAIHCHLPDPPKSEMLDGYAYLWRGLAGEFLNEHSEPEYNNIKHGMRAHVGGFSVSVGVEKVPGQQAPPEDMKQIGGSEYGGTFWTRPVLVEGCERTFELGQNVSRAWVPQQFISGLQLIGMSINNVRSRLLTEGGADPTTLQFVWPSEPELYRAPWRELPSVSHIAFGGHTTELMNWIEPSAEDIRRVFEGNLAKGTADSDVQEV